MSTGVPWIDETIDREDKYPKDWEKRNNRPETVKLGGSV